MAPSKRARPAFSPPRPKAQSSTKKAKSKPKPKRPSTTNKRRRRDNPSISGDNSSDDSQGPSALDLVDMQADDDEEASDGAASNGADSNVPSSPSEPDAILAEVTYSSGTSGKAPIPIPLIHRMLVHHFAAPDATKISGDAREVVGKYVEVFVREAIMRCAFEREERDAGGNDGWLEVGDLERAAVQLCLDF